MCVLQHTIGRLMEGLFASEESCIALSKEVFRNSCRTNGIQQHSHLLALVNY